MTNDNLNTIALQKRTSHFEAYKGTNKMILNANSSTRTSIAIPYLLTENSPFKIIMKMIGRKHIRAGQELIATLDNYGRIIKIANFNDVHFNFQYNDDSTVSKGEVFSAKDNKTIKYYNYLNPSAVFTKDLLDLSKCNPSATLYRDNHSYVAYFIGAINVASKDRYTSLMGFDKFDNIIYLWHYIEFKDMNLCVDIIGDYGSLIGCYKYEYDDDGRLLTIINPLISPRNRSEPLIDMIHIMKPNEFIFNYRNNGDLEIIGKNYDFATCKSQKLITYSSREHPITMTSIDNNKELIEAVQYDANGRIIKIDVSSYIVPQVFKFMSKKLQHQDIFKVIYE